MAGDRIREASARDRRSMCGFAEAVGADADAGECWMTKECTPSYRLEFR
jgi:hypothetical protein